ncbi:MAG: GNAT family N-acetyltransferase [archaeon]
MQLRHINRPQAVARERKQQLVRVLTTIAQEGFGTKITSEDVERHVLDVQDLYLIEQEGETIGFSSYDLYVIEGKNVLYLSGMVLRPAYQGKGLFGKVNRQVIPSTCDIFAGRTQNPVVYAARKKLVKKLYPDGRDIPSDIKTIGRILARDHLHMRDFDEETFVGRGTYGVSLYDCIPYHAGDYEFFREQLKLDFAAGDSVLLLGVMR